VTEAGLLFLESCKGAVAQVAEAENTIQRMALHPAGHLIVQVPNAFGRLYVGPLIHEFMALHPELTLEVILNDEFIDFGGNRVDVAIRVGKLDQGNLIARRLTGNVRMLCASPDYVARRGLPIHPHDLTSHACLEFTPLRTAGTWGLAGPDGEQTAVKLQPLLRSNSSEFLLAATLNGLGIALLGRFVMAQHLRSGALVEILPAWSIPETSVFVVYPDKIGLPPKTRSFVDFMVQKFRGTAPWEQ
jgi:DNA-binding transcriptional LysR family regulator